MVGACEMMVLEVSSSNRTCEKEEPLTQIISLDVHGSEDDGIEIRSE